MALATIGNAVIVGTGPVSWSLVSGVAAVRREITVEPDSVDGLFGARGAKPVNLKLGTPGASELTVANLYVLRETAGPNPHVAGIEVADRRWMWDRAWIAESFNIRRKIGVKRAVTPGGAPTADPIVDDVAYVGWSLKSGKPWTALEALELVLDQVLEKERETYGQKASVSITPEVRSIGQTPLEQLEVNARGDVAIRTILEYLPGAAITVDKGGTVRVYARTSGAEFAQDEAAGPASQNGPITAFVDNRNIRPAKIKVLFEREAEVRLDAEERAIGTTGEPRKKDDLYMENVLRVPDFSLQLASGKTVPQGTWITINEAIQAWGDVPGFGPLSSFAIRAGLCPYRGLFEKMRLVGQGDSSGDWVARIAALQTHFRRTYRINRRWMDRFRRWKNNRVATIDPVNGTRGAAPLWQDYAIVGTQRTFAISAAAGDELSYATNVTGYPSGGLIENVGRPVPAHIYIEDHDQGIVGIRFGLDENRTYEMVLPSKIDDVPSRRVRGKKAHISFNSLPVGGKPPALSATHRLITIITAAPAEIRKTKRTERFYAVTKAPSDVQHLMPPAMRSGMGKSFGPVLEVHVGPGWETARYAWTDDTKPDTEKIFGVRDGVPNESRILLNGTKQEGVGNRAASLDAIAEAVAARIYASFADRRMGSKTVRLSAEARLDGFLDEVMHSVAGGRVTTTFSMAPEIPVYDFQSLLPHSTQMVMRRLAEPHVTS